MIFENQYIQERIKKSEKLREEGHNPYPANMTKGMPSSKFLSDFEQLKQLDTEEKKDDSQHITLT